MCFSLTLIIYTPIFPFDDVVVNGAFIAVHRHLCDVHVLGCKTQNNHSSLTKIQMFFYFSVQLIVKGILP